MTTHQLNGKELLIVDVPENAIRFHIDNGLLRYTHSKFNKSDQVENDGCEVLPIGEYEYSLVLTEEDAKGVVEGYRFENGYMVNGDNNVFINYEKPFSSVKDAFHNTAIESLHSWIKSIGKDPKLVVVLVKNE